MDSEREPVARPGSCCSALDRGVGGRRCTSSSSTALREQVRSGRLAPGTRSCRPRARSPRELGVSRGVVLEAYAQLTAEGYLTATQGAPTRVARDAEHRAPAGPGRLARAARTRTTSIRALPDLAAFPRERGRARCARRSRGAPFDALGHGDPRGAPELRNELMAYLGRVRGAAPEPEHTLVCSGFAQGFAMLCRALRRSRGRADRGRGAGLDRSIA